MSDYKFYHNPTTNVSFNVTSTSPNTFTVSVGTYDIGDVVYFQHNTIYGLYAYCIDSGTREFQFDKEVYGPIDASFVVSGAKVWDASVDLLFDDVESYRMESTISKSLYSKAYTTYYKSIEHKVIINDKRREFFISTPNKSVKDLLWADDVVFADECKQIAYGVGFFEDTYTALNNKFKGSIEFQVAKR